MRILLVRPLGGLNDTLCQVGLALLQAKLRRRSLVVDLSLNNRFPTDFYRFFHRAQSYGVKVEKIERSALQSLSDSLHPSGLEGRLFDGSAWTEREGRIFTTDGGQEVTWPVLGTRKNVIVHQQWGGGIASIVALNFFSPTPDIVKAKQARQSLDGVQSDLNLHFRNSDYRSDIDSLLAFVRSGPPKRANVFSDSPRPAFGVPEEVKWFHEESALSPDANLVNAVLDLLHMSNAREFIPVPISHPSTPYSGFGLLGRALWIFRGRSLAGFMRRLLSSECYFADKSTGSKLKFFGFVMPLFLSVWLSGRFGRGTIFEWLDL